MSKIKVEKTITKSLRLTEEEWDIICLHMAREHYLSFSKYACDSLTKRRSYRIEKSQIEDTICDQIRSLSVQISKIGSNINQVVKNYNTALKFRNPDGSTVISTERTVFYFNKLIGYLRGICGLMKRINDNLYCVKGGSK